MASSSGTKYPFPSHINVTSFVTIKLNDSNFLVWKSQMQSLLRSQKLEPFIDGRFPVPSPTKLAKVGDEDKQVPNSDFDDWLQTDSLLKSWIMGTITEGILSYVADLETSAEVWEKLVNYFTESSVAREFELFAKLQELKKGNRTLEEYLRELKHVCDQLCAIGRPVEDRIKIYRLLDGLPREYESFKTTMFHSVGSKFQYCPSYDDIISELKAFEVWNKKYLPPSTESSMVFMGQRETNNKKEENNLGNNFRGGRNFQKTPRNFQRNYGRGRGGYLSGRGSSYSSRGRGFIPQGVPHGHNGNALPFVASDYQAKDPLEKIHCDLWGPCLVI